MTELKLTLNVKAAGATDALQAAAVRKTAATETLEDAWIRILAMKNSEPDNAKLHAVKQAMDNGKIGRDPASANKRFSKAEALRMYSVLAEQQREGKLAELVANTPDNYVLVTDETVLYELTLLAMKEPIIAVDTETTGLDVYSDVIVGVSLTLPTIDRHYYIPFEPTHDARALPIEALELLRPLIENESVGKVLHNAIYDIAMFRRHGITLKGLAWDTMTAMHLLNENEPSYKLKDLAPVYIGSESDTFAELFGKDAKFAEVPLDIALVYAAKDTHLTWDLYVFQSQHLKKMPEMYEYYCTVEVPLLIVIADLESNGYVLDLDFAKEYGEKLRRQAEALLSELLAVLTPFHEGEEQLNINSNQQLKPALSKAIGKELPNLDAKKTLKPLKSEFEIIAKLLEYKKITKLSGTYIDKLPLKQNAVTKRWHSRFNPMGTVTGRFSSGKDEEDKSEQGFNVQNQPKDARKMFVAPPGKVIIGADFKAQEIRCVAHLSGEKVLIDAFLNERDPYASLASDFHGKPYEEVYKTAEGDDTVERKEMKVGMLAAIYGTSKYTLAEQLNTTPNEAQAFLDRMFKTMPQLDGWIKETQEFAAKYGFVWMDGKQRKRRLPDAKLKAKWGDKDTWRKISRAKRQGPNGRVQGSSSIQTKVTMIRAYEMCQRKEGWRLWGTVHDELLFEAPIDFTEQDAQDVEDVMTNSYKFGDVPNGSDLEVMTIWGKGVPVSKWFADKESK